MGQHRRRSPLSIVWTLSLNLRRTYCIFSKSASTQCPENVWCGSNMKERYPAGLALHVGQWGPMEKLTCGVDPCNPLLVSIMDIIVSKSAYFSRFSPDPGHRVWVIIHPFLVHRKGMRWLQAFIGTHGTAGMG